MISGVPFLEDVSRIRYELELFLLGGGFDLFEEDRRLGAVDPGCWAVEFSYGKLLISCWAEGWSRSWRVTGCQANPHRLLLRCAKKMGSVTCLVELRRGGAELQQSREEFSRRLPSLIESDLQGLRLERAHLSGAHTRLVLKERGRTVAALATGSGESQQSIDASLGAGIVWLEALRERGDTVSRLLIFVPRGRAATISARLTALRRADAQISLYEVDEAAGRITPVTAFDQGDLMDNYRRFAGRAVWPRAAEPEPEAARLANSILGLAPGLIEMYHRGGSISFSLRGLEFARISALRGTGWFGVFQRKRLDSSTLDELAGLVSSITSKRSAGAADRNDWLYRAQPERWLESIIRQDITAIDPALDPRWVYSQVPACRGEQCGYIDLLATTRDGRLVVIELKVSEDAEFPLQGLDYWLRVEWHRLRGDFERRGYFRGLSIQDRPPLLYLVAPLFSFHASTKLIAGSVVDRVQIYRVGINEDWRGGVRSLLHERLN